MRVAVPPNRQLRQGEIPTATVPQTYATVPRLWPGETFVCIGGGSSLTSEDVDYVRTVRARPLMLHPAGDPAIRVIAIKEAHQLAPWADAMYAADDKFWRFYRGVPEFTGLKYAIEPQPVAWPDVRVLRDTGTAGLDLDPTGLRTGYNSGYQAVNLAVHLGAAKIVLIGFDMWRGPDGRQNWFGKHPNHLESPYPIFLQAFASIVEPLKAAGVEVVNCSRRTVLGAFPRAPLEQVLP